MTTVNDILTLASRENLTKEYPAGSNRTIYGEWYGLNGVPWCAIFVSYIFYNAGLPLPITTKKGFAYCPDGVAWAKKMGYVVKTPEPGDIVFFDFSSCKEAEHVGIVASVSKDSIQSWEGNTGVGNDANGGQVMLRDRHLSLCHCFVRPPYNGKATVAVASKSQLPSFTRYLLLSTPFMKGLDVGAVQGRLNSHRIKVQVDSIYGNKTAKAIEQFQGTKGIKVDGIVGPITWRLLFE